LPAFGCRSPHTRHLHVEGPRNPYHKMLVVASLRFPWVLDNVAAKTRHHVEEGMVISIFLSRISLPANLWLREKMGVSKPFCFDIAHVFVHSER
jgi:hypothetical protein